MKRRVLHLIETADTVADAFEAFAAARGFTLLRHDTDWSAALDFLPFPDDVLIADLDRPDDVRGFLGLIERLDLMPRTIIVTSLEAGFAAALSAGAKGVVLLTKPIRVEELDAAIADSERPAAESA